MIMMVTGCNSGVALLIWIRQSAYNYGSRLKKHRVIVDFGRKACAALKHKINSINSISGNEKKKPIIFFFSSSLKPWRRLLPTGLSKPRTWLLLPAQNPTLKSFTAIMTLNVLRITTSVAVLMIQLSVEFAQLQMQSVLPNMSSSWRLGRLRNVAV